MTARRSTYKDAPNFTPPSMEENIVRVVLLAEGAKRVLDEEAESSCFLLVRTVREWIRNNCKKTNQKYLLNSLPKSSPLHAQDNKW
jgi:hypothetical protein